MVVIVALNGGLGNQMFQYAAARTVSSRLNVPLKLDVSGFIHEPLRTYRLKHFNIVENFASAGELASFGRSKGKGLYPRLLRLTRFMGLLETKAVIRERHFQVCPEIWNAPPEVYLEGYWQSERYFREIACTIRDEFQVKHPLAGRNAVMAECIRNTGSVSVHIRRGDYATDPHINCIHGVCAPDYYQRAIAFMAQRVGRLHSFVFSDDPVWVKGNLALDYPTTVVDHNGVDGDYEDLRLMTMCKHHIIANSSFSWWGAWLAQNPDKVIIAPTKWFNTSEFDSSDLVPRGWIRM
ncbi:MAG: alpha-1,2-fucosyltransferase [Desulfomonilaceae bacterium]